MSTIIIEVPRGMALDFTAPERSGSEGQTEERRRDALEELDRLLREALARPTLVGPEPRVCSLLKAVHEDVTAHMGHRITLTTEGGVVQGLRCEDCGVIVEVHG